MENGAKIILGASPIRRLFAAGMFAMLAIVLFYMGFSGDGPLLGRLGPALIGLVPAAMAVWLWRASAMVLELADGALTQADGRVVARLEQVGAVQRGALALKPAGGFTLIMTENQEPGWVPGLWWRIGRRVAVGGVTHPEPGKAMARAIEAHLAARAGEEAAP